MGIAFATGAIPSIAAIVNSLRSDRTTSQQSLILSLQTQLKTADEWRALYEVRFTELQALYVGEQQARLTLERKIDVMTEAAELEKERYANSLLRLENLLINQTDDLTSLGKQFVSMKGLNIALRDENARLRRSQA